MAIYRIGGYTGSLVREQPEIPQINTPEKGEPLLLKSLGQIEDYSRSLVLAHDQLINEIKNRLEKIGNISIQSQNENIKILNEFNYLINQEIRDFDKIINETEELSKELVLVDQLYSDVNRLSDLLTSLEHFSN